MKTAIVQVTKDYLCLTCCEPILQNKDQKKEATADLSYRFTSPYVKPLNRDYMEGKNTLWEVPKAFATMVHDGLREMKRPEVKEVIVLVEEFDLVSAEFQHARCNKKTLNGIAVDNLKEVLQNDVKDFSIITTTYGTPAKEIPELTSKTYGIPKALSTELTKRFSEMGLTLLKITPAEIPMLKVAREVVYSYNKTVCYMSIDYAALRVVIVRDSLPIYSRTFTSPIIEAIDIVAQDRQLSVPEALEYIKQYGLASDYSYNTPAAMRRIENLRADLIADVVHNINLVAMSLDLTIDQAVLSDYVGFFPKVTGSMKMIGISKEVEVITDQFNTKMALPELDIDARDSGFKTGSYILFNNLMNCGDKYKNNLMVGLQPLKEKSINMGRTATIIFAIVSGAAMLVSGGYYAFLNIQAKMDENTMKEDKYVKAADLLSRQQKAKQDLEDLITDMGKLPKCPLSTFETLEEAKAQISEYDGVTGAEAYSLSYADTNAKAEGPAITIPMSGKIDSFDNYIKLKDRIVANGFFEVDKSLNLTGSSEGSKSSFNFSLSLTNIVNTKDEQEKYDILTGKTTPKTKTEDNKDTKDSEKDKEE
ncbi:MAG: hypothetical protein UHK60_05510 [Acutalibacteraceae bacterium]|nr:hypothetical protein [Acutalibacteraceae bacterium]